MKAGSAIVENADWRGALSEAERELSEFGPNGTTVDLAVFFASPAYATEFDELLLSIQRRYRPRRLIGCSGQGVIGVSREMEGVPALSLMLLSLPGAELTPARFTQREVEALETAPEWR
ncbi:MAG: hypothetical protein HY329_02465, partial [Chloroflexi bacterium]|nr:hypothetical protein [Chloroflexota bacterium]